MTSATATKATAGKPATKAATDKPKAPPIDFGAITATDAPLPVGARTSAVDGTPVIGWLQDSAATDNRTARTIVSHDKAGNKTERDGWTGKGKSITVPVAQVEQVTKLLRQGARRLNVGLRVVPGKPVNGSVTVAFAAKSLRGGK